MNLLEIYFAIWATTFSLASLLLIPFVQGTTAGNILALASVGWALTLRRSKLREYLKWLGIFLGVWLVTLLISQLGLKLFSSPQLPQILSIDYFDPRILWRKSIFSQSLYLFACFFTFLFFVFFYESTWRRYIFWGAWFLAFYGIYEWFFYLFFKETGDFIANRTFMGGEHSGSWSQVFHLGKLEMLRIKSTTGEPSFLALAGIPLFILAIDSRKWALSGALLFCLLLSLSTTAYIALFIIALFSAFYLQDTKNRKFAYIGIGVLVAVGVGLLIAFPEFFNRVFAQKLSGQGDSGSLRQHVMQRAWEYWLTLSFYNKIFGIGFGAAFVTPLIGGVLVNLGLLGVLGFVAAFAWPLYKLPNTKENWALKAALIALFFMLSVSVADFTYLTTWMILGMSYRRLRQIQKSGSDDDERLESLSFGRSSSGDGKKRRRRSSSNSAAT